MNSEVIRIINNARETLADARFGLEIATGSTIYEQVRAGVKQAISLGRASTFALQHLKGKVEGFEVWYTGEQERMKANPLFVALNASRTKIIHDGSDPVHMGAHIHSMKRSSLIELMSKYPAPHPNATFFIGDPQGRSGWMLPTESGFGIGRKFYVELPTNDPNFDVTITAHLRDISEEHNYEKAEKLLAVYLDEIDFILEEAERRFISI